MAVEELRTMRTRIDSLNATLNDLENKNAALSVSILIFSPFIVICNLVFIKVNYVIT